jgi:hypothetical protein
MALTDKEQAELNSLNTELEGKAPQGSVEAVGLSPEEETELAQLNEELGEPRAVASESQEPTNTVGDLVQDTGALIRGAAGAIPGYKQAAAVVGAGTEYLTDTLILGQESDSFADRYHRNMKYVEDQEKVDAEQSPIASGAGELAGFVAGTGAVGGLLKSANLVGKGVKGAAALAAGDSVYMGLHQISTNGLKGSALGESMGKEFGMSIASQLVLGKVGKFIAKAGQAFGDSAAKSMVSKTVENIAKNTDDGLNKFIKKHQSALGDTETKAYEKIRQTLKTFGADDPKILRNPQLLSENIENATKQIGEEIEMGYVRLNAKAGNPTFSTSQMLKRISNRVQGIDPSSQAAKGAAERIMKQVQGEFLTPSGAPREMSLLDLWKFRMDFNDPNMKMFAELPPKLRDDIGGILTNEIKNVRTNIISTVTDSTQRNMKKVASFEKELADLSAQEKNIFKFRSEIDETQFKSALDKISEREVFIKEAMKEASTNLKSSGKAMDDIRFGQDKEGIKLLEEGANINKLSKDYEILKDFNKMVLGKIKTPKSEKGFVGAVMHNVLKAPVRGLFGASIGGPAGYMAVNAGPPAVKAIKDQFESLAKSTTDDAIYKLTKKVSNTFQRLDDGSSDPFVRKLSSGIVSKIVDDNVSDEDKAHHVDAVAGKLDLYDNPLERSDVAVKQAIPQIMDILVVENPQFAEMISNAMDNQEDLGPVFDQLSKDPNMQKLFKSGIGWNGKVYDAEDKAMLSSQVLDDKRLSQSRKYELIRAINEDGAIPNLEQEPGRQPKSYAPRQKWKKR